MALTLLYAMMRHALYSSPKIFDWNLVPYEISLCRKDGRSDKPDEARPSKYYAKCKFVSAFQVLVHPRASGAISFHLINFMYR